MNKTVRWVAAVALLSGCASLVEFSHNKNTDPLAVRKIAVVPLVMSDKIEGAVLGGCWETELMGLGFKKDWAFIMTVCMMSLTIVVALFNIFAILMNIKLSRKD